MGDLTLTGDLLTVTVSTDGAEPTSLLADGRELLWQAGPQWRRHAPVLFPVIGRVVEDEIVVRDATWPMGQHGFARDSAFQVVQGSADRALLRLTDSERTRQHLPFPFTLDVDYAVEGSTLRTRYRISTDGPSALPFSIGSHPAFAWPLVEGVAKDAHAVVFEQAEPAPVRQVVQTLLTPDPVPTPVEGHVLRLRPELFADDAIVMEHLASRSLRYGAPGTPSIRLDLHGFEHLGVWSKPTGADFVCLEPWAGLPSPQGPQHEYRDKPYQRLVRAGEVVEVGYDITVLPPA